MNEKEFMTGVPEYNRKFFRDQLRVFAGVPHAENKLPMNIFLPNFKIKSANELIGKNRWIIEKYKKYSIRHIELAGIQRVKPVKERRLVVFKRLYDARGRSLDDDNLRDGFKYLRDHLKRLGWIYEDSRAWIDTEYIDRRPLDHETWGVKITVKEANNG